MDKYIPEEKYTVLVRCYTYNHALYVEDALKGFAMQKTDFPYVCVVVDDASTDGEREVIISFLDINCVGGYKVLDLDYSELILATHKDNPNCHFAVYLLKENLYKQKNKKKALVDPWRDVCAYEATCEGDDYWNDKDKLQRQIDFLNNHPDYSLCSHRIYRYDQDSGVWYKDRLDKMFSKGGCVVRNTTPVWITETSSVVYRISSDEDYRKFSGMTRDNIHVYFLLKNGKGFCLPQVMSVYRQHQGGIFSKQSTKVRLTNGSYKALKQLYEIERTQDARYLYYRCYANTFIQTKGRILIEERFSLTKFLSIFYFIPSFLFSPHPVYKPIQN